MLRSASHIILSLAAALAVLLAASCSADRCDWADPENVEGTTYLSLRLCVSPDSDSAGTRADEAPGEAPEGRHPANAYENAINNLTIFFTPNPNDLNDPNDPKDLKDPKDLNALTPPFDNSLYIDLTIPSPNYIIRANEDGSREVLIKLDSKITVTSGKYFMLAVANYGDLTNIKDLNTLRRTVAAHAWQDNSGQVQKTGFVMSSFDNQNGGVFSAIEGDPQHSGTKNDPYYGECTLMRLASRIDLCCSKESDSGYGVYTPASDGKPCVVYEAVDESDDKHAGTGTVYLLGAEPVNSMREASYLLRHSYKAADIENLTAAEQFPLSLTCGGLMETDLNKEELNYIIDPNFPAKVENPIESTLDSWFGDSRPGKIRTDYESRFVGNALVEKFIKDDFTAEDYNGKKFDRSLTICYVNENTYKKELKAENYATGLCFKTVFVPATVYESAPRDDDDDAALAARVDADYAYGLDFWHLRTNGSDGHDIYFSNEDAARTYKGRHPGVLTYHPGGVSYYHIWIRHAQPKTNTDSDDHVMNYAIVRNHIYRVLLTFKGPGFNRPFESEIPNDIEWKIFTRDWNQREWNMVQVPDVIL